MTRDEALIQLSDSTAEAVASVLRAYAPEGLERGRVNVLEDGAEPFASMPFPAVATTVNYVDGITGGNVFAITLVGAKKLAAAMMGADGPSPGDDLSELELSAVGEAMNQMMAAAAAAGGTAVGEEVEIAAPQTAILSDVSEASAPEGTGGRTVIVSFSVLGESARLVQVVPSAFLIRMTRALAEREIDLDDIPVISAQSIGADALRNVPVRVWAELGRSNLPVGRAVGLSSGTVVELDRAVDEAVELYVSGRRFAAGELVLVDGEWAVRVTELTGDAAATLDHKGETL